MTEPSVQDISPNLFVLPDGSAMQFTLHRCPEFFTLLPLIVAGGGELGRRVSENSILLIEPGCLVDSDAFIHVQYVRDCIRAGRRLSMEGYKVIPGIPVPEMPSRVPYPPPSFREPKRRIRKPFTKIESEAVKNYIVQNGLEDKVNGHSIWKSMEELGLTSHSAEVMRSHYRQVLARNKKTTRSVNGSRVRRIPFTAEEDAAMLDYVRRNCLLDSIHRRKIWEQMRRELGMVHSAESMRSRFRRRLLGQSSNVQSSYLGRTEENTTTDPSISKTSNTVSQIEDTFSTSTAASLNPQRNTAICSNRRVTRSSLRRLPRGVNSSHLFPVSPIPASSVPMPADCTSLAELIPPIGSDFPTSSQTSSELPSYVTYLMNSSELITSPLQVYLLVSMTNGSVAQALNFLRTGLRYPDKPGVFNPPLWTPEADAQLKSTEISVLRGLIKRYGHDEVCTRIAYLAT